LFYPNLRDGITDLKHSIISMHISKSRYFFCFFVYATDVAQRISVDIDDWGGWLTPIKNPNDGTEFDARQTRLTILPGLRQPRLTKYVAQAALVLHFEKNREILIRVRIYPLLAPSLPSRDGEPRIRLPRAMGKLPRHRIADIQSESGRNC
jgi:hypothetical protein